MKYSNITNSKILKDRQGSRRVLSVLIIIILICLLEFIAGVVANSFALISDAGDIEHLTVQIESIHFKGC